MSFSLHFKNMGRKYLYSVLRHAWGAGNQNGTADTVYNTDNKGLVPVIITCELS